MALPEAPPEVLLDILARYPYFTAKVLCRSNPEIAAICHDPYYWSTRAEIHFHLPRDEFRHRVEEVEARGSPPELAPAQVYLGLELIHAVQDNDVPRVDALMKEGILEDPLVLQEALRKVTREHFFDIYTMLTHAGASTETDIKGFVDPSGKFRILTATYHPWAQSSITRGKMCNTFMRHDLIRLLRLLSVPLPEECRLSRDTLVAGLMNQNLPNLANRSTPDLQYQYCFRNVSRVDLCKLIHDRLVELNAML